MPHITYFDARGRAEPIRLILEESATPYSETRVALGEWTAVKPALPLGQTPSSTDIACAFVYHPDH